MTPTATDLERLLVALLVGLLIGLDRERAEVRKAHGEFAGVRTFPLIALAGCVPMLLEGALRTWLVVGALVAVAAIVVVAYWEKAREEHVGATTEVAAIVTFLLGVLAGAGMLLVSAAAGIAVAVLLVAKVRLEAVSRAMTAEELTAVLELAVISVVVLPLLPNRGFGPWQVLNPRDIWLVVVLVAGLSFAGFVAVRVVGEHKGLAITGALGGLVSSTAVTVAMADRSRSNESLSHPAAAAATLASAVMALRVIVLAGAVNTGILPRVVPMALAMAIVGLVASRVIARPKDRDVVEAGERIRNPFSLRQAAVFAAIYAAILLTVRATQVWMGSAGVYAAAALGSLADVDAVTIAFTRLGPGDTMWRTAGAAVAVAVVMNTLVKLAIGWSRGSGAFRRDIARALGIMALAGAGVGAATYVAL